MQSALVYKLSNLFLKAGASQFDNINEFLKSSSLLWA